MSSAPTDTRTAARGTDDTRFFGHPWPLANLFGVEMWERFSFYGMQAILAYYIYYSAGEGGLGYSEQVATGIVGAYGGLVYLSAIAGSWVADRLLGSERTLFASAILVMIGHIALAALPGVTGLAVGLVCVAVGSGGVKANATVVVGSLYAADDERRDGGFSLFYMGVNLGAFIGPLLTGWLQTNKGFHWGFGAAAVGMALGLAQYTIFRRQLPQSSHEVPNPLPRKQFAPYIGGAVAVAVVIAVLVGLGTINVDNLADIVLWIIGIAAVGYFAFLLRTPRVTPVERRRVWAFVPMVLASTVFWSLYQQQFTVVAVYADKRLDRNFLGWDFPQSWVQSINPVFIIALAPLFAALWTRLGPRQPSTPNKFALGVGLMGVAFLMFLLMPSGAQAAPIWGLALILLVFTLAELNLSPVGLSLSTKLAPEAFTSQMVGLFYLSVAFGSTMAGKLGSAYDSANESPYFWTLGIIAIVVAVLVAAGNRPVLKLMGGVR
ncbi:peptide MFS transporter [Flexivirga meconopsidis]|uniref:peptide MFS transporter n=1 Tax=Flexivirga meconopsidis TaxID=2977121 RepID=UPI00223FA880|nr:peptide MFS transporter [Flexivirga meconopsidis]